MTITIKSTHWAESRQGRRIIKREIKERLEEAEREKEETNRDDR